MNKIKKRGSKGEVSITIRFQLSEKGQKRRLKRGRNGKREQSAQITLSPNEIDLFEVDEDGRLFIASDCEFDGVPNARSFVAMARRVKKSAEAVEELQRRLRGERPKLRDSDDALLRLTRLQ
jgi:hypothetical protein